MSLTGHARIRAPTPWPGWAQPFTTFSFSIPATTTICSYTCSSHRRSAHTQHLQPPHPPTHSGAGGRPTAATPVICGFRLSRPRPRLQQHPRETPRPPLPPSSPSPARLGPLGGRRIPVPRGASPLPRGCLRQAFLGQKSGGLFSGASRGALVARGATESPGTEGLRVFPECMSLGAGGKGGWACGTGAEGQPGRRR